MKNLDFIFTKDGFILDDYIQERNYWIEFFTHKPYEALFELGFRKQPKSIQPSTLFLYRLSEQFIQCLSSCPELEIAREKIEVLLDEETCDKLLRSVPFAIGSEYINEQWIYIQFQKLNHIFSKSIMDYEGNVQLYLQEKSQDLRVTQRIYFHLVENSEDKDYPFAFLVTYATKDNIGRFIHVPLKHALVEFQNKREQLLQLLSCLNEVANENEMISQYMKSGELFYPIRLTIKEAYHLLKSVPSIEKCGIKCRVPNWWKKKTSHVHLNVSVGDKKPSLMGLDSLVESQPSLMVNGHMLSSSEIHQLLKQEEGLTWLKGQWVEINHQHLHELLDVMEHYDGTMTLREAIAKVYTGEEEDNGDLGVEISNGQWLRETIQKLKNPSLIKKQTKPKYLKAKLRPYQKSGYHWLNQMYELGFGACLADDMGLGKTLQVISFLERLYEQKEHGRVLLIVPASLIGNWKKEIDTFAPKMTYHILHGKLSQELNKEVYPSKSFITITTYQTAMRVETLKDITWQCLILDEAQAIKNPGTKQTRAIKQIPSQMRIAMTGTPIENDLSNLWSLFDFLNKGLLGSSQEFKEFNKKLQVHPETMNQLRLLISPFLLRRLKTDKTIISDLPDKIEIKDNINLTKRQIVLYRNEVAKTQQKILESEGIERRGLILALLTKLKQICNHPDQFVKDTNFHPSDSGKYQMLEELCETIYQKRERVLVFTQYKEMCEPLNQYLETIFHKKGYVIHGGISVKKRTEIVEKFNDEKNYVPYIVLSLKAAGTGLNLVLANHVIHFDRWWNPAVENQATDRAYRIGQNKNVFVHKLVCSGTIEDKIDQLIASKQELANSLLSTTNESWLSDLSNEDIINLLKLDIEEAK